MVPESVTPPTVGCRDMEFKTKCLAVACGRVNKSRNEKVLRVQAFVKTLAKRSTKRTFDEDQMGQYALEVITSFLRKSPVVEVITGGPGARKRNPALHSCKIEKNGRDMIVDGLDCVSAAILVG